MLRKSWNRIGCKSRQTLHLLHSMITHIRVPEAHVSHMGNWSIHHMAACIKAKMADTTGEKVSNFGPLATYVFVL
jgi:hypothetical protein